MASAGAQVDQLVYDLYGLTEDEIKIVKAAGISKGLGDRSLKTAVF